MEEADLRPEGGRREERETEDRTGIGEIVVLRAETEESMLH